MFAFERKFESFYPISFFSTGGKKIFPTLREIPFFYCVLYHPFMRVYCTNTFFSLHYRPPISSILFIKNFWFWFHTKLNVNYLVGHVFGMRGKLSRPYDVVLAPPLAKDMSRCGLGRADPLSNEVHPPCGAWLESNQLLSAPLNPQLFSRSKCWRRGFAPRMSNGP